MKAMVLIDGEYSEQHVVGVFTDMKKLEDYLDHIESQGASREWFQITECEIDVWPYKFRRAYRVYFYLNLD